MIRRIRLTHHAEAALVERGIDTAWVLRALAHPDAIEPDTTWPDALRAFRALPEREGRVLRVVYVPEGEDAARAITVLSRPREEAPMKSRYDAEADILYLRFADVEIIESEEIAPGVVLDLDPDGRIVAVELQRARERVTSGADLVRLKVA